MSTLPARRGLAALAALFLLAVSGSARAQETFADVGGTWWLKIGGKDAGAALVAFTAPAGGTFAVEDVEITGNPSFGFSRALEAFFGVDAGQSLAFDAKGNVIGELELTDPESGDPIGTLVITSGKPNKKFTKLNLKGTIEPLGGEPTVVKLAGVRPPEAFPVLSGRTASARVSGKGVKSEAFDLSVNGDTELGLPAYTFTGAGPVTIDKQPVDATVAGRVMITPTFQAHGLLEDSSDFGTGIVKGKLKLPAETVVPKVDLVAQADRKVRTKGKLVEPVEPILSVTPTSFDFGAIALDATRDQIFEVENVGVGTLSGEVTFLDDSDPDFVVLGETSYEDLEPGDPPFPIVVRFEPGSMGDKTATLLFSVAGGAGAKTVELTGVGGVAAITVDPTEGAFDDTTVGQNRLIVFTVTNDGDGILDGNATIAGANASDFALIPFGQVNPGPIDYSLDPGEDVQFSVRFAPAATGDKTATLTLTGGGGETVLLTGTGQ